MNRFFVYEGTILRAALPKFTTAMRYFKEGRKMYWGTPDSHLRDLTNIANTIQFNSHADNKR